MLSLECKEVEEKEQQFLLLCLFPDLLFDSNNPWFIFTTAGWSSMITEFIALFFLGISSLHSKYSMMSRMMSQLFFDEQ